jgi:hypothetical protein
VADIDFGFIAKVLERWPGYAYLAANEEMRGLLIQATEQEWSPELFEAKVRSTNWWRTTNDKVRSWAQTEGTDPATAARLVNAKKTEIAALAVQLGGSLDDDTLGGLAWQAQRLGWDDQTVRMQIANLIKPGTAQMVNVNAIADQYMIDIGDDEAADYTRRLFTGEIDEGTLRNTFAARAQSRFPGLAELMKGGATPGDYFADYRTMIARYTDTPTSGVDLIRDPEWSKVLSTVDDKGQLRPMTLGEATKLVRGSTRYQSSTVGKAESAEFTDALTTALGTRR